MRILLRLSLQVAVAVLVLGPAAPSWSLEIGFAVNDIADVVAGEDRYEYRYFLEDFGLPAGHGFTVFFDAALYSDLEATGLGNADWDVLVFQPDAALPDPGGYDGLALVDDPSTQGDFRAAFTWLGDGAPGSQPFEVYDPNFQTVETGATAAIPEPGAGLAFLCGLIVLSVRSRRGTRLTT